MVTSLVAGILLAAATAPASAGVFAPPPGEIFAGVTTKPVSAYQQAVGKHPAVYQEFVAWGQYVPTITDDATAVHARMMMAIVTSFGSREAITPGGIASGKGDGWLLSLQNQIALSHNVTYIRLMAEMNGYWNPFCAYNQNGSARDANHTTTQYKRAWKRITLIMRGGSLTHIDAVLHRLHMPPLHTHHDLPTPQVAMLFVPEAPPGNPAVPGNSPRAYYPGNAWVDWVGTDFYSKFKNWSGITQLYDMFQGKPFVFGEYALWDSGDDVSFIDKLFGWAYSHPRTKMLMYNQDASSGEPFQLWRYPHAAHELRVKLASSRFPAYAPGWGP